MSPKITASWIFFCFSFDKMQVKKRQQRVLMILDSKNYKYEVIDIAEPGKESDKEFMQEKSTNKGSTASDQDPRHPLPPQIFADDEYCGEYDVMHIYSNEFSVQWIAELMMIIKFVQCVRWQVLTMNSKCPTKPIRSSNFWKWHHLHPNRMQLKTRFAQTTKLTKTHRLKRQTKH